MDCGSTILIFLAFIQATCGQSVTLTGPPDGAIEQGSDVVYTCTGGTDPYTFTWTELSVGPTGVTIFIGEEEAYDPLVSPKYVNFGVAQNGDTSTMTITNTLIEDEGQYGCVELPAGTGKNADAELTVEVNGTLSVSPNSPIESNINDTFEATCEALEGRPEVTITWMLDGGPSPCDDVVEMSPTAGPDLFSKTSVCTFQATSDNNGKPLTCVITGHKVSGYNGEVTATLDKHNAPRGDIMTVEIQFLDPSYRVTCNISEADQPNPRIRNYYIYSGDTLIHQSSTGVNFVDVPESEYDTNIEYNCIAENYLGSTTTYPPSTTTLIPTTTAALETATSKVGNKTGSGGTGTSGLGPGAYAGIAIGVIACIVIIVLIVLYLLKPECCPCFAGSGTKSSGSSKPAGSAVGSSNGSERDVESPLNGVKDVTAEEKTKPEAAPRGHGSIQHTNDNPNQDMYAMVDKKPSGGRGGDAPDRGSGPGQNEPQGMLYADLDLSHKAGHTDKHVPKNENDVVVYSSILV